MTKVTVRFDEISESNDLVVSWVAGVLWRRGYMFIAYDYHYTSTWVAEVFKRDMFRVFMEVVDDIYLFRRFIGGFGVWICDDMWDECIEYSDEDYEKLRKDEDAELGVDGRLLATS